VPGYRIESGTSFAGMTVRASFGLFSRHQACLIIEHWNLRFICNLPARRFPGGVLEIWNF
jgi:hypothetical protein